MPQSLSPCPVHASQGGQLSATQGGRAQKLPKQVLVWWGEEVGRHWGSVVGEAGGVCWHDLVQGVGSTLQGEQQA